MSLKLILASKQSTGKGGNEEEREGGRESHVSTHRSDMYMYMYCIPCHYRGYAGMISWHRHMYMYMYSTLLPGYMYTSAIHHACDGCSMSDFSMSEDSVCKMLQRCLKEIRS